MRLWETHDDASDQRFPPPVPLGSKAAMRAVTPQALLAPPGEVERLREEFDGGGAAATAGGEGHGGVRS